MFFVVEKWSELPFRYVSVQNVFGGACPRTAKVARPLAMHSYA